MSNAPPPSSGDEPKPAWVRRIERRMDFVHETAMKLQAYGARHGVPPPSIAHLEREPEEE
jgi:hypothetical protein